MTPVVHRRLPTTPRVTAASLGATWDFMARVPRAVNYALAGGAMGLVGAPLGLFVARSLAAGEAISWVDVHGMPETYAYVALTACLAWGWLGRVLGIAELRIQSKLVAAELLAAADGALHAAKRAGGGRIVVARN